jgi:hypothetical protein
MKLDEYLQYDAVGLAECVARGDISAMELLDLALRQSAVAQPKTNAICRLMENEARSQLKKPLTGPFAGVPFLIKDCAQDYAGLPMTYASRSMLSVAAPEHAHVVRRYLDAGLLIFGKTNLPELALKAVSDSQLFGRANNPGILITRLAVPAAALRPRSPRALCRWRQAMTVAAPSAYPPPVAACSGCGRRADVFLRGRRTVNSGTVQRAKA